MAKAPNSVEASNWDGAGSVWFKVYELNPVTDGGSSITYPADGLTQFTFNLPSSLPSGQYLVRVEHIALHGASQFGGAQFYISCAQINVTNGGNGNPGPKVPIPGVYTGNEPGILLNIYWPVVSEALHSVILVPLLIFLLAHYLCCSRAFGMAWMSLSNIERLDVGLEEAETANGIYTITTLLNPTSSQNCLPPSSFVSEYQIPTLLYSTSVPVSFPIGVVGSRRRPSMICGLLNFLLLHSAVFNDLLDMNTIERRSMGPSSLSSPVSGSLGAEEEECLQSNKRCAMYSPFEVSTYGKINPRNSEARWISTDGILRICAERINFPGFTRPKGPSGLTTKSLPRYSNSWL
ncbi:hypothetical protein PTI98_004624 [Pleurotus ostreatus]|nr:hypothetical protein PTI98_004624 [Pleurotus ostreatus]